MSSFRLHCVSQQALRERMPFGSNAATMHHFSVHLTCACWHACHAHVGEKIATLLAAAAAFIMTLIIPLAHVLLLSEARGRKHEHELCAVQRSIFSIC